MLDQPWEFKTDNLRDTAGLECPLKHGGGGGSVGVLCSVQVSAGGSRVILYLSLLFW